MTFWGNIVYLRLRSVICGPSAANDTARAQITCDQASLLFFLRREGTPDTITLLFVCRPLIKFIYLSARMSAMLSPDKNEPNTITGSRLVGGNYTRYQQREFTCSAVQYGRQKYGLFCKTQNLVKVPFHFVSQQKTKKQSGFWCGVGCTAHKPNANMADHSVVAQDERHESEVSQSSMCCFDNAYPENSCFVVDLFCFISLCLRVAVFLNTTRRVKNLPPFTSKGK